LPARRGAAAPAGEDAEGKDDDPPALSLRLMLAELDPVCVICR
jgi:hypothetical protein